MAAEPSRQAKRLGARAVRPEQMIGAMIDDTANGELASEQQASMALLDRALDLAGVAVWSLNLQTQRLQFSGHGLGIVGLPAGHSETDLQAQDDYIHPDDRAAIARATEDALAGNDVVDIVARYRHADGSYRRVLTRRVAQRDAQGRATGVYGIALDVNELHAERDRAREAATHLQMVAQAVGVGFWTRGDPRRPMQWSSEMFRLYARDAARGAPSYDEWLQHNVHPEDRGRFEHMNVGTERDRDAEGWHEEFRVVRDDGQVRWIESRSRIEVRHEGVLHVGMHMDVTPRRQAETELETVQERAQNATEGAGMGVWARDLIGRASFWNAQMYRLRGFDPADPRPVEELARLSNHPDDQARLDELVRRHIDDGVPYEHEMRVTWPDGSVHWLGTRGNVVRSADGTPVRMSGVNWDITQHKLVELALRDKQAAEQASHAKSEFLARMSHELRTPLNAVLGFTQLMASDRRDPPSQQQRDRLAQMQRAGRHLLDLINDVLDLAGVESGAATPPVRRVSLDSTVRESLQWVAALAAERQVTLNAREIGGTVLADRRRMRQILTNLLSNAVKYNRPGGSVEIETARRTHEGHEQWGVVMRDTGIGMTEAQVAQLFQPFNRLGAEFSTVEGTGIGLTIVRQIVHRMGGCVEVDSKPRMGSTFTVWLPAAPDETIPVAFDATAPMSLIDGETSADRDREAPLRVLCIEDNPVNLLLVKELFTLRPGLELITASSGAEGIAAAQDRRPHLVLLDMQLPDMHGLDVLKRLRDEPLLDKTRFVALSANAMAQDVAQALGAGFEDYWTKPIDFGKFLAGIDAIAASRH